MVIDSSLVLFSCTLPLNFPNTICWRSFAFFIMWLRVLCWKLSAHIHVGLFLGFWFYSLTCVFVFLPIPFHLMIVTSEDNLKLECDISSLVFFFICFTFCLFKLLFLFRVFFISYKFDYFCCKELYFKEINYII